MSATLLAAPPAARRLNLIAEALRHCADALDAIGEAPQHDATPGAAEELLEVSAAARKLEVSAKTIYRLVKRRELAAVHVTGSLIRIPARSVEAFKRRHTR